MPSKKHLTRKEAKAQRAGTSLQAQAASLLTMDAPFAPTSSRGGTEMTDDQLTAMYPMLDRMVVSDEPRAKAIRQPILAGPGHEDAQQKAHEVVVSPSRLEDKANLATVQKALNVVIGLDQRSKKCLPLEIDAAVLKNHQAAMGFVVEYYEILQERAEETELGLKLWATSEWILELAQEAWDGCAKWLEIEGKPGDGGDHSSSSGSIKLDTETTSEASYDLLEVSRPSSPGTNDYTSTSFKASTHVPNNYFGAYQEELEKGATSCNPNSSDPATEDKIKKVEASLQSFYQIQDTADKNDINFVEASPSPRWLLGALLQARMSIELLEKQGQPTLTRYQRYALDLARRAEGEFEKMQRSEEERAGPEVWGSGEPAMRQAATSSKPKQKKDQHATGPQQHDSSRSGRVDCKKSTAPDLAEATHTLDLASSMPAVPNSLPFVIPNSENSNESGAKDEDEERAGVEDQEGGKPDGSEEQLEDAHSDSGASTATDSSAEINAWAAEAVRIRFGGDTAAGAERARRAIFAGPGHEEEQQEVRNMLFPPWNPPEDRMRFAQVQETLNIVLGIPGVKETRTGITITVEADVLEANRAAMERIIDYYADLQERGVGMGRNGDIMGTQKVIIFYAQQAWCVCDELLEELERQRGQV